MKHKFTLIDSTLYVKFKNLRHTLYFINGLLIALLIKARSCKYCDPSTFTPSFSEMIGIPAKFIYLILLVFIPTSAILYFITKQHKKLGYLELKGKTIEIYKLNEKLIIHNLEHAKELRFSRGSTVHYQYKDNSPPETNGTYVSLEENNTKYLYEILINDEKDDTQFIDMIRYLNKININYYYESI